MRRHQDLGTGVPARPTFGTPAAARHPDTAMAQADRWPDGGNDTDLDYYDTPAGNIWRPDTQARDETRLPDRGSQTPHRPSRAQRAPSPTARTGRRP